MSCPSEEPIKQETTLNKVYDIIINKCCHLVALRIYSGTFHRHSGHSVIVGGK